jgi:hypothetical protein
MASGGFGGFQGAKKTGAGREMQASSNTQLQHITHRIH